MVLEQVYFDKDGKHLLKDKSSNLSLYVKDGEVTVNIETIKKGMTTQDLMMKGCVIYVPSDIKTGDVLPDRNLSVRVGNIGGTIRLTERKVLYGESDRTCGHISGCQSTGKTENQSGNSY